MINSSGQQLILTNAHVVRSRPQGCALQARLDSLDGTAPRWVPLVEVFVGGDIPDVAVLRVHGDNTSSGPLPLTPALLCPAAGRQLHGNRVYLTFSSTHCVAHVPPKLPGRPVLVLGFPLFSPDTGLGVLCTRGIATVVLDGDAAVMIHTSAAGASVSTLYPDPFDKCMHICVLCRSLNLWQSTQAAAGGRWWTQTRAH